ncbi:endoribonuclease Dcr-1 isoform X2 [Procambarus clarkii]|uniref:endoribonuclease Dcr-1 isoform X2 n=1 Tax=Procambarus clarkii TaxID=6728 RepID=UPI001E677DC5|nr:endoribonuclease Dicer-like isoform X2 [Procambarus clarkii]
MMMNRVQPENVHSTIFTPREYQVELVDACLRRNTLSVLASRSTRTFLITMVTRELAHLTRSKDQGGKGQRTLITGWSGPGLVRAGEAIQQNTNLVVTTYTTLDQVDNWPTSRWNQAFREAQVLIMTVDVMEQGLQAGVLPLDMLNLLVITDAHRMATSPTIAKILSRCGNCRILGMSSPVLSHTCSPPQLESFLNHLQKASSCKVDTASEIVTVLRYVNKPVEKIVMCRDPSPEERLEVELEVRRLVADALGFLGDHRYDLVEVYGPEYQEFCDGLPDPNNEPRQILMDFLDVLNNLGLWCADRAALYALVEVEKLKKKTAYDRHYLLLCMIFTVMARIRAVVEQAFDKYTELDQILKFSTPKVLRLVEILRQVRPLNFIDPRKRKDKVESNEMARIEAAPTGGETVNDGSLVKENEVAMVQDVKEENLIIEANANVTLGEPSVENIALEDHTNILSPDKILNNVDSVHEEMNSQTFQSVVENSKNSFENTEFDGSLVIENVCKTVPKSPSKNNQICDYILSESVHKSPGKLALLDSAASESSVVSSRLLGQGADKTKEAGGKSSCNVCVSVIEDSGATGECGDGVSGESGDESDEIGDGSDETGDQSSETDDVSSEISDDVSSETSEASGETNDVSGETNDVLDDTCDVLDEMGDVSADAESDAPASKFSTECTIKAVSESHTSDLECCTNGIDINEYMVPLSGSMEEITANKFKESSRFQNGIKHVGDSVENGSTMFIDSMQSTVQMDPDTTQISCNIYEAINNKESEDGSVLEDDLCRLNIKESSCIDGCELEILLGCDPCNGHLSAKSEPQDTAKLQNIKNVILCNGFAQGGHKCLTSRISKKNVDLKLNGYIDLDEHQSGCEDGSDSVCVAKAGIESCDSVQNQFCMETCQHKDSLAETSAFLATSELPTEAVAAAAATHVSTTTSSHNGVMLEDNIEQMDASNNMEETKVNIEQSEVTSMPDNATTNSHNGVTVDDNVEQMDASDNSEENKVNAEESKITSTPNTCTASVTNFPANSGVGLNSNKEKDQAGSSAPAVSSEAAAMADTLALLLPSGGKGRKRRDDVKEKVKVHNPEDPDSVCGLIFVHHRNMAKIIYRLLKELSDIGGDYAWIFPQYTVEAKESVKDDPRAAEAEHKKQEEVLRRFRHHECNVLVSTRVLEEGIDVPQCNLVLRFDPPTDYRSYVHSCGRARGQDTFYFHLITKTQQDSFLCDMATYSAFQQVLVSRCGSVEVGTDVEVMAEEANSAHPPYITPASAAVTMASAIGLLNKYCAKLPSDTFTRLTAMWEIEESETNSGKYCCRIMLPINSPLKGTIQGPWQEKMSLAKMSAALECCRILHQIGELDDQLQPVGKESMKLDDHLCAPPADDQVPEGMPRPGTTKRRQYYYKKVAECLTGEQPKEELDLYVYKLDMVLTCPIPDEQNTRGRKIYRPEKSARSFGIVTTKPISQVSGFPVFTRSGEVVVHVRQVGRRERYTQDQLAALQCFHKFTFTHVLRLEKYPIKFDPTNAKTAFYIVPLNKFDGCEDIDWEFVTKIQLEGDPRPVPPLDDDRKKFQFEHSLYEDAVVMPWYRNQDQPQYFYVAEICAHLNPQSDFPDAGFETFEKYYLTKYGLQICNLSQPLLDVDHTSGRLNLLTPRHVNRKGVALPTTSEETKRAKRENLQQKQILVPELCTIHPFPASLWRKAVCLPTILYRINALLLADQLRICVASEVGLGLHILPSDFSWPPLDFGWSLADVLKKNQDNQMQEESAETKTENISKQKSKKAESLGSESPPIKKKITKNGIDMEIGTWSNDMAVDPPTPPYGIDDMNTTDDFEIDTFDPNVALPDNLTLLDGFTTVDDDTEGELGADWGTGITERKSKNGCHKDSSGEVFRVGSPSNFEIDGWDMFGGPGSSGYGGGYNGYGSYDAYGGYGDFQGLADDLEGCESDVSSDMDDDDKSQAEKMWDEEGSKRRASMAIDEGSSDEEIDLQWPYEDETIRKEKEEEFHQFLNEKQSSILGSPCYLAENDPLIIEKAHRKITNENKTLSTERENLPVGKYTLQGCEQIYSIGCDNAQQTTSPATRIVNRTETLSVVKLDNGADSSSWMNNSGEASFSFDYQPDLINHPGPPPSIILQALTMSNANDGVNLERLETIGDSFLKYAITTFLYCTYPQRHEGKLSYLRSKQVSNLNLYRLGKRKGLGECMVATKFEPHDNWLPPGYFVPRELEEALIDSGVPAGHWNMADLPGLHDLASDEIRRLVQERSEQIKRSKTEHVTSELMATQNPHDLPIFIPYNLLTQHSIPDKSIADCVEALIGAYLTTCGPRGALLFMSWLGIKVLPCKVDEESETVLQITYGHLEPPQSPLYHCPVTDTYMQLELLLSGYTVFEDKIGYTFRDRSYLLQAFTHASYYKNRLTDCYQRLEFLGDAVLDYLITRHLYEDKRQHSPGALTDLRSALVNNTIFASLAVKYDFHKYFRHFSPGLDRVVRDFVKMQEENGHKINEEYYFMEEDECEAAEDIEVPKALGDVFESVAGAIFLDSGGSLDAVWSVYYTMMCREIEQFSGVVPKSPIRELLEMEPETAKFGKPERLVDGKVRVSVEIFGKGSFSGVGRNYRIAKSTAAKRALRHLKKLQMMASQGI